MGPGHGIPVGAHGGAVQDLRLHLLPYAQILGALVGVADHSLQLFPAAAAVALALPAVGVEGIALHIDRLIGPFCPGYADHQDLLALHGFDGDVRRAEDVDAGHPGIVDHGPEFAPETLGIRQIHRMQGLVPVLLHAQQKLAKAE